MRILIIGPSWVGDSVMAQTLYKRLKDERPDCNIDVVSPQWCLRLMERMPEISSLIGSPVSHGDVKILSRYKFGKQLERSNYDRAIILTNSIKSSLIPFFSGIPIRTGWLGEMRYGLLNDIRTLEQADKLLMIEKFAALSIKKDNFSLSNLSLPRLKIDFINQKEKLDSLKINESRPFLAICPGAEFGPSKRWPAPFYSEVAKTYIDNGWSVICLGSNNDEEIGKEIEGFNDLGHEEKFYNLIGKTSLLDAIDLLALCKRAVTNDSGLMHISAAVGTPLVAVYGPSSPDYTPPLIDKKVILRKIEGYNKIRKGSEIKGYHSSLLAIKPEEVLTALESL